MRVSTLAPSSGTLATARVTFTEGNCDVAMSLADDLIREAIAWAV
jgi:hypothetical protein